MNSNTVFQIRNLLQSAQSLLIALPADADDDTVGASLALYLTLQKMRKQVSIVSPNDIKVGQSHFYGVNKITKQIAGGNTLVISLPYKEGTIEKVSYNIEGERFNLVIEPRGERLTFNPDDVAYNFGKGEFDTVIVIGANDLTKLGVLYKNHAKLFDKSVLNIDNHSNNSEFGQVNIVEENPISQIVALLFKTLRIPLDADPASNLYTGIIAKQGTIDFDTASPDLLDAMAYLRRSKGQLLQKTGKNSVSTGTGDSVKNDKEEVTVGEQLDETPEDWLKPKIFSSKNN